MPAAPRAPQSPHLTRVLPQSIVRITRPSASIHRHENARYRLGGAEEGKRSPPRPQPPPKPPRRCADSCGEHARQPHIETDTDYRSAGPKIIAAHLYQDTAELMA